MGKIDKTLYHIAIIILKAASYMTAAVEFPVRVSSIMLTTAETSFDEAVEYLRDKIKESE